jgi:hypothetical protein
VGQAGRDRLGSLSIRPRKLSAADLHELNERAVHHGRRCDPLEVLRELGPADVAVYFPAACRFLPLTRSLAAVLGLEGLGHPVSDFLKPIANGSAIRHLILACRNKLLARNNKSLGAPRATNG